MANDFRSGEDLNAYAVDLLAKLGNGSIDTGSAKAHLQILLEQALADNLAPGLKPVIETYSQDLLRRLSACEIDTDTATSDVLEMISRAEANDPDFGNLLDLCTE